MADCGSGALNTQVSLEHLRVPESKKLLKNQMRGACQRVTGANLKECSMVKLEQFELQKIIYIVLGYNPKYTVKIL